MAETIILGLILAGSLVGYSFILYHVVRAVRDYRRDRRWRSHRRRQETPEAPPWRPEKPDGTPWTMDLRPPA
jgi:hypothetical protein